MNTIKFAEYLRDIEKLAPASVSCYRNDTESFLQHLADHNLKIVDADTAHVYEWLTSLRNVGNTESTVARKLSALRKYCEYLVVHGYLSRNPTKPIRSVPRTNLRAVHASSDVAQTLLQSQLPYRGLVRDAAIVALAGMAGLRVSEILRLQLRDLRPTETGIVVHVRTKPAREIHLCDEAGAIVLDQWTSVQKTTSSLSAPLFAGPQDRPLTRQAAWKTLRQRAKRMGVEGGFSPSELRSEFIAKLVETQASRSAIAEAAGLLCGNSLRAYKRSPTDHQRGDSGGRSAAVQQAPQSAVQRP